MEYGIWNTEHGIKNMEYGIWDTLKDAKTGFLVYSLI